MSRIAASTAPRASCGHLSARCDLETPLLGLGNLANVLAATAVALQFDVPLDAIAARAAALAARAAPRRAAAAAPAA